MLDFRKMRYPVIAALAAVMSSVAACDSLDVDPGISLAESSVSSDAGHTTVDVSASGKWALSLYYPDGSESWASLTSPEGRGSKDGIFLSYEANPSETNRSLRVILTTGNMDYAVSFTQLGKSEDDDPVPDPDPDPAPDPKWLELPALRQSSTCHFYYHDMTLPDKSSCRNYSFLWDKENLVAHWVAYPLNKNLKGSGDRTNAWGYDPLVPKDEQPVIFEPYDYGYQRGHQIPSADRYVGNSNEQTFYFTNMTPQRGSFNGGIWATLEEKVRNWSYDSDTLYVVTGCVLEGSLGVVYDNAGKAVTIPGGYFKALLSYKRASTHSSGEYTAAGFWFEHKSYSSNTITDEMKMSIDDLEKITGMDFFVNLPARIGQANADRIEAANPDDISFWN